MRLFTYLQRGIEGPNRFIPCLDRLLQSRVESTPVGSALTGGVGNPKRVEGCGPYSVMVKQILYEMGIDSIYILSTCWDYRASANVSHAFVVFCLGGKWYQCDPTITQFLDEPLTSLGVHRVTPTILSPITDPTALGFLNKKNRGTRSNDDRTNIPLFPLDMTPNRLVELLNAQQVGIPDSSIVSKEALGAELLRAIPVEQHPEVTKELPCIFGDSLKFPSCMGPAE